MLRKRKGHIKNICITLFLCVCLLTLTSMQAENMDYIDTMKFINATEWSTIINQIEQAANDSIKDDAEEQIEAVEQSEASFSSEAKELAVSEPPADEPDEPENVAEVNFYIEEIPLSYELQEYSYQTCLEHNIQYELFLAVMWKESRFEHDQVYVNTNGTTDTGLMQINDVNRTLLAEVLNITDLRDPQQNIRAGAYLLADLLHKYEETNALVAYQFGEGGMVKREQNGQPPPEVILQTIEKRDEFVNYRTN